MSSQLQEERLPFWDRLTRGQPVSRDEVDRAISRLSHDASDDERTAAVLLLAAVHIANGGSRAMRQYLRAGLLYWFSQAGSTPNHAEHDLRGLKNPGLIEIMGLQLTWPQALRIAGVRVRSAAGAYVALRRLQDCLRKQMAEEWTRVFGTVAPSTLEPRR